MVYPLIQSFFADDTSLCSVFHGTVITISELDSDFATIKQWDFLCKISCNPDLNKQAQEVIFSGN